MNFICIDPGLSGTGIAVFKNKELLWWDSFYPKGLTWKEKANHASVVIGTLLIQMRPDKLFIEWPTGRFNSRAGLAAQNTDGMLKLSYLIGKLSEWGNTTLVPVINWKGNLPKEVTQKRAEVFFQRKGFKNHAADAVGLGAYIIQAGLYAV